VKKYWSCKNIHGTMHEPVGFITFHHKKIRSVMLIERVEGDDRGDVRKILRLEIKKITTRESH
jgi:hypothetical protein